MSAPLSCLQDVCRRVRSPSPDAGEETAEQLLRVKEDLEQSLAWINAKLLTKKPKLEDPDETAQKGCHEPHPPSSRPSQVGSSPMPQLSNIYTASPSTEGKKATVSQASACPKSSQAKGLKLPESRPVAAPLQQLKEGSQRSQSFTATEPRDSEAECEKTDDDDDDGASEGSGNDMKPHQFRAKQVVESSGKYGLVHDPKIGLEARLIYLKL